MAATTEVIRDLFLVLNIKSSKKNIVYNYQIEYVYNKDYNKIFPRRRILKFANNKLEKKMCVSNDIEIIEFLNNEMKIYN